MVDDVREAIRRLANERGDSYAALSRLLGRNSAYVQQFMTRGSPTHLNDRDRHTLAVYFGVSEATLGGRDVSDLENSGTTRVPRLSIQASAGPGRLVDGEFAVGAYSFDKAWLKGISRARPTDLSIIKVSGDSMAPTLTDGDDVLVDQSDAATHIRDGIYVFRSNDVLLVKRVALDPTAGTLTISSDNAAYPTWRDCKVDNVSIAGRVIWIGRTLV